MLEVARVRCLEGRGLEGDRFLDFKPGYKGQVTFFAEESHEHLVRTLGPSDRSLSVYRRNVITRGLDLVALVGVAFELQGVRFEGTAQASPCEWMDLAFGSGACAALRGRGGLRARILSTGHLRTGPARFHPVPDVNRLGTDREQAGRQAA